MMEKILTPADVQTIYQKGGSCIKRDEGGYKLEIFILSPSVGRELGDFVHNAPVRKRRLSFSGVVLPPTLEEAAELVALDEWTARGHKSIDDRVDFWWRGLTTGLSVGDWLSPIKLQDPRQWVVRGRLSDLEALYRRLPTYGDNLKAHEKWARGYDLSIMDEAEYRWNQKKRK